MTEESYRVLCEGLLALSDAVRNDALPPLGIRLEDGGAERASAWKRVDPQALQQEREARERQEALKREARRRQEEARAERERRAQVDPRTMFRGETEAVPDTPADAPATRAKYSAFDSDGIPTHDAEGNPLSAKQTKKLRALWEKQKKLFDSYQQKNKQ